MTRSDSEAMLVEEKRTINSAKKVWGSFSMEGWPADLCFSEIGRRKIGGSLSKYAACTPSGNLTNLINQGSTALLGCGLLETQRLP